MSGVIKVALFGVGRIGQIHLQNLVVNKRVQLVYIVDQNEKTVRDVLDKLAIHDHVKFASLKDIDVVLADQSVDAVVICTPTGTHVDLTLRALHAGKHVLCEKPISESTAEITKCFDVADQRGKVLQAAFNRKFDASYRAMYDKVRSGDLGELQCIRSTFRDTPLWLGAHTLSQTFLCHDIDILCWFNDSLPETVVATGSATIKEVADKNDIDILVVTMKFPNGSIGVLDFSRYSCYGYDIRLEVLGSKGMLKLEPLQHTTVHEYTSTGKTDPAMAVTFTDRFAKAYVAELEHFVDVIQGKAKLFVTRAHSERAAIVNDAIRESYEHNKIVHLSQEKT